MPTRPDPNSPFMDARVEAAFGVRSPGMPTSAGKPGVQAADVSFPAAPGVATAPPGRPAAPTGPAPVGGAPAAAPSPQPKPAGGGEGKPGEPAMPAMPTAPSSAAVAPSSSAATPLGVASRDPMGNVETALSPEGGMRYREVVVAAREALGPIPRVFRNPNLPEMPVEMGGWNYNPFTGAWHKPGGGETPLV